MKYQGSKNKIADKLLSVILKDYKQGQTYIEPFVGGCNMIDKVYHITDRLGNDKNFYLIEMWKALQKGWKPPIFFSEEEYKDIRANYKSYNPELVGYVGFCSFGANFFSGYPKHHSRNSYDIEVYCREYYNNIMKQLPFIDNVKFTCLDYFDLNIPDNSLVYCDPPYAGTTGYNRFGLDLNIDHNAFWQWVRDISKKNIVYVSEYTAPDDFECVLDLNLVSGYRGRYTNTNNQVKQEKLFRLRT